MTKTKLHETILELCATHNVSKKFTEAISELTKPKVGGSSDVNDYTVFGEDGTTPIAIFCTFHKRWEPVVAIRNVEATEDTEAYDEEFNLFVADEKAKNGFRRFCDEGDKQWKEAAKIFNASKNAIVTDILDGNIEGPAGKTQIDALQAARDVHASRVDGLGDENRPGAEATEAE